MTNIETLQAMRAELSVRIEAIDAAIDALREKEAQSEKKKDTRQKRQVPLSDPAAGSLDFDFSESRSGGIRLD